jgi:predicted nuclease of predicted toxin-antitoxin system
MERFLTDENFNRRILQGLLRRRSELDIVWVQDVHLRNTDDRIILGWAVQANRVLLTHDVSTITKFAEERFASGLTTAGIVVIREDAPIGRVIDDLLFLMDYNVDEWENTLWFIPFPN